MPAPYRAGIFIAARRDRDVAPKYMKSWFLFALWAYGAICTSHGAALEHARGTITFTGPSSDAFECAYEIDYNPIRGNTDLKVTPASKKGIAEFVFQLRDGEAIPEALKIDALTSDSGDFLFVYWGRGASAIWLTVIGIGADGKIGILADYSCHGEIYVADFLGKRSKQIVVIEDSYAAKEFVAEIFEYKSPGVFQLTKKTRGKSHHFLSLGSSGEEGR